LEIFSFDLTAKPSEDFSPNEDDRNAGGTRFPIDEDFDSLVRRYFPRARPPDLCPSRRLRFQLVASLSTQQMTSVAEEAMNC
jgi:hypothetical protein